MKVFSSIFIILFCAAFCSSVSAQRIDSVLNIYANNFTQERIYLQYDKPTYAPGETIWFKAYLMAGIDASAISKNFYADMYDAEGKLIAHSVFPIVEASARGQFDVPDSIVTPFVHVRAYTSWMLNFDTAFLYEKDIRILQKKSTKPVVKQAVVPSLQFYPEGGDALIGIPSKIAFKAVDQTGKPVKVKGTIVNNSNAIIDTIKTRHDGMGYIRLLAKEGETYTAKWTDEQGTAHTTVLPTAKTSGATIELNTLTARKGFLIRRTATVDENLKQLHVVGTMHQQMVYMANIKLQESESIGGVIPTESFPSGVMLVTLFSNDWQPLAERICFINNHESVFTPEVGFTTLGLGKRGKNAIDINLPDTIIANLSASVTDKGLGVDSSDNIISRLLLTGDLRGKIYKPTYYFTTPGDSVTQHLDLVMLTNGWRRYNWQAITQGQYPKIKYPADTSYLTFSGKVFGATSTQLRGAGELFAIIKGRDSSTQTVTAKINSDGSFGDPNMVLFDSAKIYYQFIGSKNMADMSEVRFMTSVMPAQKRIVFDKANMIPLDTTGDARLQYLANAEARLQELLKQTTLQSVTVRTKVKSPMQIMDEKYASGLFQSGDAYQFDVNADISANAYQNIFAYLQGKVAGLQINTSGATASLTWRGGSPSVYLNEMQSDVDMLSNTSMSDVAYVKIFRPPFMGGFNGANGAIAVYTKKGGDAIRGTPGKGLPYKNVIGYTVMKEYYSPDYGTIDERNEKEDIRGTLLWVPMIITSAENHKIRLTFYNNDVTDAFRVIVEGVTKDGQLVHIEKIVE